MRWPTAILLLPIFALIVVVTWFGLQPVAAKFSLDTVAQDIAADLPPGYLQSAPESVEYVEVVRFVDREVVREVPIQESIDLREFNSIEELEQWLAADDTNEYVYFFAGEDGVPRTSDRYDCDDYAMQLQRRAAESGYLISVALVEDPQQGSHMINLVIIGNDIYYVEPQTDEVWFHVNLD